MEDISLDFGFWNKKKCVERKEKNITLVDQSHENA